MYSYVFSREKSRIVLLPFPKILAETDIAMQLAALNQLEQAKKKANRAIGLLISLGKELEATSDKFVTDNCIELVSECLGPDVGPRVMKNYIILMFFIQKVCIIIITLYLCYIYINIICLQYKKYFHGFPQIG